MAQMSCRSSGCFSSPLPYPLRSSPPPPSAEAPVVCTRPPPKALAAILNSKIIACLRAQDENVAMEAARAALSAGISVLEITMSTPGVLEVIKGLLKDYPSSVIGVGTVINVEDATKAIKAGAQFLMSPSTIMEILLDLRNTEVLYIPGAMTPTEVLSAYSAGASIVKIYPVSVLGGDRYILALKRPFPQILMVASQGITTDSIRRYLNAGASAVVLSDAIFEKEAMRRRDFSEIHRLAHLSTLQASVAGE